MKTNMAAKVGKQGQWVPTGIKPPKNGIPRDTSRGRKLFY